MPKCVNKNISLQIQEIFEKNKLDDLNRFIKKRQCLNNSNSFMIYLFHIVQSAGILTTTIATGYSMTQLIWVGVGLNVIASLINCLEQVNNSMSNKLMKDIDLIKNDTYVDEGILVEPEKEKLINTNNKNTSEI
jgi:hypothetical protein